MKTMVKGSEDYRKAQELANKIQFYGSKTRRNDSSTFDMCANGLGMFLNSIEKLGVFASEIAKTVGNSMNNNFMVARVSSKQAWILACAGVENGIELTMSI